MLPAAGEAATSNGWVRGGTTRLFEQRATNPRKSSVCAQLAWLSLGFWLSNLADSDAPVLSMAAVFGLMAWK